MKGVLFVTYGTLIGDPARDQSLAMVPREEKSRLEQIWSGPARGFRRRRGVRRAHAMTVSPSRLRAPGQDEAVPDPRRPGIELQDKIPDARISTCFCHRRTRVYNLGYATRPLGLWGDASGTNAPDFVSRWMPAAWPPWSSWRRT